MALQKVIDMTEPHESEEQKERGVERSLNNEHRPEPFPEYVLCIQ